MLLMNIAGGNSNPSHEYCTVGVFSGRVASCNFHLLVFNLWLNT